MIPRVVEGWYGVYDRDGELDAVEYGEAEAREAAIRMYGRTDELGIFCAPSPKRYTVAPVQVVAGGLESYVNAIVGEAKAALPRRLAEQAEEKRQENLEAFRQMKADGRWTGVTPAPAPADL